MNKKASFSGEFEIEDDRMKVKITANGDSEPMIRGIGQLIFDLAERSADEKGNPLHESIGAMLQIIINDIDKSYKDKTGEELEEMLGIYEED